MGGLNSGVQIALFIPFALFMLFIFFYLLSDTADEYLSPALERITEMTGMSESLAGVTLLAFGNGAPDIFASIASASSATRATNTNIIGDNNSAASALLGSAFFIISVVQTLVTRAAKPDQAVKVTPVFFIRDLVSVFISLLYLLIHILFIGFINIWSSIGFFLLYLIFVIVVLITNKR
jgi:sodium/potassium/calcium exchanger 6